MLRTILCSLSLSVMAVGGCVPASLDLNDRPCPCAPGWSCDTARNRCVLGVAVDSGGLDAARDAAGNDAASDAARLDASLDAPMADTAIDAFASDVGSTDAFHPDAPMSIDSGSDAGHDGGMPGDTGCTGALASAILCDGFETEPGPWTSRSEFNGLVVNDGVHAARGNSSLHGRSTMAGGHASRDVEGLGPFVSGDLWVRVSIYIPMSADIVDFTWLSVGEIDAPYHGISLGMGSDLTIGSYSSISDTYVTGTTLVIPRDTWTCLELHVVVSDTVGAIEVYDNGVLGGSATGIDTRPAGELTRFSAGVDYSNVTQGPIEVWLDEVALSTTRLPCP